MIPVAKIAIMLLANALIIRGLWRAMSGSIESPMLLTWLRLKIEFHLGTFWAKPLTSCPACMASFHGTWFYLLFMDWTLVNLVLLLLYIPALSTVTEYIHERI